MHHETAAEEPEVDPGLPEAEQVGLHRAVRGPHQGTARAAVQVHLGHRRDHQPLETDPQAAGHLQAAETARPPHRRELQRAQRVPGGVQPLLQLVAPLPRRNPGHAPHVPQGH